MAVNTIQTSFNGGELSPRLSGRVDQAMYQVGTAEMLNFVPTIEGPALKRSGFRYIRAAAGGATWLSPFIFSVTQAYVLEWGAGSVRFYTNGGRIESGPTSPYSVAVPYAAAEAPVVSQQQSYDRLYLAHGTYPPASLLRTSGTTFTYGALTLKNGPFADRNSNEAITVTASGTTGTVTITASSAIFLAGHVGGAFMVEAMGFSSILAWEPLVRTDTLNVGDLRRSDGKVYQCVAKQGVAGSQYTGTIQPTHTRGAEWDGSGQVIQGTTNDVAGAQWLYLYDVFGVGTIAGYISPTQVTVSVTRRFADSLTGTAPSYRWSLPALSAATGWPKQVVLAFGRLIFFTDFEMMASVIGDYGAGTVNMAPFSDGGLITPDQAFRRRLDISNPILWAKVDRDVILVGTADGIYAVRKINSGQIFSSDNAECVKQSHFGVSACPPAQAGNSTIVVQAGGRKLREVGYQLESDSYVAPTINVWQRHILGTGAAQLAFQGQPDEMLWAVRSDGVLALHPHVPEQDVRGFSRLTHADGPVLSACSIPGSDGVDQLWALVNGVGGRSVQLQDPAWLDGATALADAFYVDSGATYSGAPTVTVSGLSFLANRPVAVLADGAVVSGLVVSGGGTITLPVAASKVQVGLGFTSRITTLPPEVRDAGGGSAQGRRKRVAGLLLRLLETAGVKIDAGAGHADELIDRKVVGTMDTPVGLFTGIPVKSVGGSYGTDATYTIISDEPLPCMVLAAMPKLELSEK